VIKLKEIYKKVIEEIKPTRYTLYCDMDGVLVDFEKRFEDTTGLSPNAFRDKYGLDKFWKLIDDEGVRFWVGMPWMPDGKQLYDYIKPNLYSLLSSPSWDNSSRLGKRLWVRNNIPGTKLILAARKNKQDYAKENSILIDDLKPTIDEWNAKGGIGILHTSAASTIKQLKELGL
tara:strand:- start:473 stop:994 length:522 start_codon:yes stop_codon:yes gene_type:complete